jgi:hypothetical protein
MNGRAFKRDIPPAAAVAALTIAEVALDTTPNDKRARVQYQIINAVWHVPLALLTTASPASSIAFPAAGKGVKSRDPGTNGTSIPEAAPSTPLITSPSPNRRKICLRIAEVADVVVVVGSLAPGAFDPESAKFIGPFLQERGFRK